MNHEKCIRFRKCRDIVFLFILFFFLFVFFILFFFLSSFFFETKRNEKIISRSKEVVEHAILENEYAGDVFECRRLPVNEVKDGIHTIDAEASKIIEKEPEKKMTKKTRKKKG